MRILPYKLPSSASRAALLSFVDVTQSHALRRMQAILDAMAPNVAVVDREGVIAMVNASWLRFAAENGAPDLTRVGVGANYLGACLAPGLDPLDAGTSGQAATGLRAVLQGRAESFELEYPCDGPDRKRWFLLHVRALPEDIGGAVVSHIDVSAWKYPVP